MKHGSFIYRWFQHTPHIRIFRFVFGFFLSQFACFEHFSSDECIDRLSMIAWHSIKTNDENKTHHHYEQHDSILIWLPYPIAQSTPHNKQIHCCLFKLHSNLKKPLTNRTDPILRVLNCIALQCSPIGHKAKVESAPLHGKRYTEECV